MHNEKRKRHYYDRRVRPIESADRYRRYMDDGSELFGTTAGAVHAAIKAILKENVLHGYEVCRYVRLENGNGADVYNTEVVVALAFRIRSQGAARLREYILRTLGAANKRPAINILMACTRKTDGRSRQISN